MDKQKVNKLIPIAYKVLSNQKKLDQELRGYISTFGVAITMGSLPAAIAFYSSNGSSKGRSILPDLILEVLREDDPTIEKETLFDYVTSSKENDVVIKEQVLNATIAIKLALNLFLKEDSDQK